MIPWIICALAIAAAILLTGICIGFAFAQMNPSAERPVRVVKARGQFVDRVV